MSPVVDYTKIDKFPGVDHFDSTNNMNENRTTTVIYTVKKDEFDQMKFTKSLEHPATVQTKDIGDSNFAHLIIMFMDF